MAEFPVQVTFTLKDQLSYALSNIKNSFSSLSQTVSTAAGMMIRDFARDTFNALSSAASQASSNFIEFEQTLTRTVGATSATGKAAEDLTNDLNAISKSQTDLGFSARESAAALEALVKAGMSGSDAAEALRASLSLARIENIDTATAANYLVQTLTQFHLSATQSADALNLISKAADAGIGTASDYAAGLSNAGASAANMGISLQETLAALVILDKTFGSATESGTFLNMMFKDLVMKSDQLGISLYNSDGSMKSLSAIIGQLREKVTAFGDNQQAVNEYLSVFDVRAQRAVVGLLNYDGSLDDVIGSMNEARDVQDKVNMLMDTAGGKLAELAARQENATLKLGDMTAGMQVAWKEFAVGLGSIGAVADALGPSLLQGAMNGLIIMLPTIIKSFNNLGISTANLAISMGAAFAAFTLGYTLLSQFTANMNPVEKAIVGITVAFGAAAIAAITFWTAGTAGVALPIIMASISTAIMGVVIALEGAGVEMGNFSGSTTSATSALQQFTTTIQTQTATQIQALETALATQVSDVQNSYDEMVNTVNASYDEQLTDTRTFYDDLIAEVRRGLSEIQNARSEDLDDLELNYLLQKQALKEMLASNKIDQETFNAEMEVIEQTYRDTRADISDTYRIQELQYEQAHRGEIENLESEKNTTIENMEAQHASDLERLEQEKNAEINRITAAAMEEKVQIISSAQQRIIDNMRNAYNEVVATANQIAYTIQNLPSFEAMSNVYPGTLAQYNALPYEVKKYYAPPPYAEGGIVTKPTLALVGEREPELIIPRSKLNALFSGAPFPPGSAPSTQHITVYPTIYIGSIGSPADAAQAVDIVNRGISESFRKRTY